MGRHFAALAIPPFLAFIGLELAVGRWRGRRQYRAADALSNLLCCALEQASGLLLAGVLLGGYTLLQERLAPWELDADSPWTWALALLGVDFLFYWGHRASHAVGLLWAVHAVHHQSEEYNFSVALRQSALSSLASLPFYLPLAVLGVPAPVFAAALGLVLAYQFLLHTELVGRLGPLEAVLNTPSHHRVHHGLNREYVDQNFGAVLIVWDRLFGTWTPELAAPAYGVATPLASWSPLRAQLRGAAELWRLSRRAPSPGQALQVWLRPPGWHPRWLGPRLVPDPPARATQRKYEVRLGAGLGVYVTAWTVPLLGAVGAVAARHTDLRDGWRWAVAGLAVCSAASLGALLERRSTGRLLELLRLLLVCACGTVAVSGWRWWGLWAAGGGALCVTAALWMLLLTRTPASAPVEAERGAPRRVV